VGLRKIDTDSKSGLEKFRLNSSSYIIRQNAFLKSSIPAKFSVVEHFHSRDQHTCKFIGTKEIVDIRKEFNSHKIGLVHQHGHRFIVLEHH